MSSKEDLCLWCGRFTESRAADGRADCDRRDCIEQRDYGIPENRAGGIKTISADGTITLTPPDATEMTAS